MDWPALWPIWQSIAAGQETYMFDPFTAPEWAEQSIAALPFIVRAEDGRSVRDRRAATAVHVNGGWVQCPLGGGMPGFPCKEN